MTAIFYTAGITHWSLGLWALYERRQFRYRRRGHQLVLGLSIPSCSSPTSSARGCSRRCSGATSTTPRCSPTGSTGRTMEWVQFTLLLVAWVHGCIGLYLLAAAEALLPARRTVPAGGGSAAADAGAARDMSRAGAKSSRSRSSRNGERPTSRRSAWRRPAARPARRIIFWFPRCATRGAGCSSSRRAAVARSRAARRHDHALVSERRRRAACRRA